jgi:hypothetical protein
VLFNLNQTHQLLLCGDDVGLLGENINTMKKKITENLSDANKDIGLEIY